ncbi:MAG: hypothetical protein VKP62_01990 [Candidatus Sericytochromatia bacterium]|nr:hypothetical protein [Candidatus Sericytochromatia bacterium]
MSSPHRRPVAVRLAFALVWLTFLAGCGQASTAGRFSPVSVALPKAKIGRSLTLLRPASAIASPAPSSAADLSDWDDSAELGLTLPVLPPHTEASAALPVAALPEAAMATPTPARRPSPVVIPSPVRPSAPVVQASPLRPGSLLATPEAVRTPVVASPMSVVASPTPGPTPKPLALLLAEGRRADLDLLAPADERRIQAALRGLSSARLGHLAGLMQETRSDVEAILILKALGAGEPDASLADYAKQMRGQAPSLLIANSTMRDPLDLRQQWKDACGPAMFMVAAGEVNPRYAWQLNQHFRVAERAHDTHNRQLAEEQKRLLEEFNGVAVPYGSPLQGRGIVIPDLLRKYLTPVTGVGYRVAKVGPVAEAVEAMVPMLQDGYDLPIVVSWDRPEVAAPRHHFMLAIAVRGGRGDREILVHDTDTGRTQWVHEAQLSQQSAAPLLNGYTRLTHWYEATPARP